MQELLKNAWGGWLSITDAGKLVAILLTALLLVWFTKNEVKKHVLFVYATIITVICIFPISAVGLMLYQTKFYDYQWIWTVVPMTIVIAWGGAIFLHGLWEDCKRKQAEKVVVTLGLLAALIFCGSMGNNIWKTQPVVPRKQAVERLLSEVVQDSQENVCLWGTEEVLEYARSIRGDIQLYYGRNMWDKALNAYSYDTYSKEKEICYQWMIYAQDWGGLETTVKLEDGKVLLNGVECIREAREQGVNVICLPDKMTEEALKEFETELGMTFEKYGDEWLVWIAQKRN